MKTDTTTTQTQEAAMTTQIASIVARLIAASNEWAENGGSRTASQAILAEAADAGIGREVWAAYEQATRAPAKMVAFAVVDGFLHPTTV